MTTAPIIKRLFVCVLALAPATSSNAQEKIGVGVGNPDLLVYKKGQMNNSYGFIKECSGIIPTGVAVQWGNYEHVNPQTGKQVTVPEIHDFGKNYLGLSYIFWCTQEPYYSKEVIIFLEKL